MLNISTLAIVLAMISMFSSLAFLFIFLGNRQEKYLKNAFIAFVLISFGLLFFLTRYVMPYWFSIVIANVLVLSGLALLYTAVRQLFFKRPMIWVVPATAALSFFIFYYFSIIEFETSIRMIVFSIYSAAAFIVIARIFQTGGEDPELKFSGYTAAALYFIMAIFHLVRVIAIFMNADAEYIFMSPAWNTVIFAVSSVNLLFAPLIFMQIINQRYQKNEKEKGRTDYLTGVFNRRGFENALTAEQARCERSGGTFCYLALDLDHFKLVNDRFGHQAGDQVLVDFARILQQIVRAEDTFGRIGGEEFALLMPNVTIEDAAIAARRILEKIRTSPVQYDGATITYTASIGIACSGEEPGRELYKIADKRLYEAKRLGRDCYVSFLPDNKSD